MVNESQRIQKQPSLVKLTSIHTYIFTFIYTKPRKWNKAERIAFLFHFLFPLGYSREIEKNVGLPSLSENVSIGFKLTFISKPADDIKMWILKKKVLWNDFKVLCT